MKAICVPCQLEYRCEKNEVVVEIGGELWSLDKYKCHGCGHEMLQKPWAGQRAFAENLGPDKLAAAREKSPPEIVARRE